MKKNNLIIFSRYSIITAAATYFLIFIGGLVRVSGAGLGCPDWPKCFGRWIPPLHVSQLPPGFDPAEFNFTLAWIEYLNRLAGMSVGLLIAILALWTVLKFRKIKSLLIPSVLAAILVAYQGWQGSQVVSSGLEPYIISIHMGLAFIIGSLLIYVAAKSYLLSSTDGDHPANIAHNTGKWILGLWVLVVAQVILGTRVREAIENLLAQLPLLSHPEMMSRLGAVSHLHALLGVIATILIWFLIIRILYKSGAISSLTRQSGLIIAGLSLIQIIIGPVLLFFNLTEVLQVMHMWLASLMTGFLLILYTSSTHKPAEATDAGN